MRVRSASFTSLASLACFGSVAAFSLFVACKGNVDAIGAPPREENDAASAPDASSTEPDASAPPPDTDGAVSLGPGVPACPECCAQCLTAIGPWVTSALLSNGSYLYWANDTSISRMAANGGSIDTLVSGRPAIRQFAIDSTSLYWTEVGCDDGGAGCASQGNVLRAPIDGGSATYLARGVVSPGEGLAVDQGHVYWSDESGESDAGPMIRSVSLEGGDTIGLASTPGDGFDLVTSDGRLYWVDYGAGCFTADAGVCSVANLLTAPVDGGATTIFADAQPSPFGLSANDGNLTWVTWNADPLSPSTSVLTAPTDGGPSVGLLTLPSLVQVVWDDTSLYWATNGVVLSARRDGGAPTSLAVGQSDPGSFLVTDTSLFWVDAPAADAPWATSSPDAGAIMKLTPK